MKRAIINKRKKQKSFSIQKSISCDATNTVFIVCEKGLIMQLKIRKLMFTL